MKRSTDRILTTHVGSLAGPTPSSPSSKRGTRQPYDRETLRQARSGTRSLDAGPPADRAASTSPRRRSRAAASRLNVERFNGFARKPAPPGREATPGTRPRTAFADYYAGPSASRVGGPVAAGDRRHGVDVCTGRQLQGATRRFGTDIDNLRNALKGLPTEEVFCRRSRPLTSSGDLANEFYRTDEGIRAGRSRRAPRGVRAIVDAGFVLQSTTRA